MDTAELILRLAPALTMVVFGLHQMLRPQEWLHYIPEWASRMSPMKPQTSMRLHALGNVAFGLFLASGWHPVLGAWIAVLWWLTILPFAFRVSWAIGLRDLTITLGLVALILLIR
jgi:uncharacterized protein YjeT (DUF2065 family)